MKGRRDRYHDNIYTRITVNLFPLFALLLSSDAIPVDNGVEGEPFIDCGATFIGVTFTTRNPFEGHVFVKTLYNQPECRNDEGGSTNAGIRLAFDSCNVRRTRSLNPKGVFVSVTVIITFHPLFITKVDRAYNFQCFYMESDKTVSTEIDVSMLTTQFRTQSIPMPVCRYEILDGGPNGPPVGYALVGQAVYHKWSCDTETQEIFCMSVHSCYVDDGSLLNRVEQSTYIVFDQYDPKVETHDKLGDRVHLLDGAGCAQDRYLLRNLEYLDDLSGGQETHVFKYADRPALFFQCQITISIKEPFAECLRPICEEPIRGKRSSNLSPRFNYTGDIISVLTPPGHGNHRQRRPPITGEFGPPETVGVIDVSTMVESLDIEDKRGEPIQQHYSPILSNGNAAKGGREDPAEILNRLLAAGNSHMPVDGLNLGSRPDPAAPGSGLSGLIDRHDAAPAPPYCMSSGEIGLLSSYSVFATLIAIAASVALWRKRGQVHKTDVPETGSDILHNASGNVNEGAESNNGRDTIRRHGYS